jgi:hypothetical protein
MTTLMIVPDRRMTTAPAQGQEKGFVFRVPFCERRRTADRMWRLAREHDHAFELDHVGLFGKIRCTYRQRNETAVLGFLAEHMRDRQVRLVDDYQRRYGVIED